MNDDVLLILLLVAVAIAIVLLVVLLLRKPDAALALMRERLEDALRGEQREGRGELRQQLDSLSLAQEQRIENFGTRLDELTTRTDARLDVLRTTLTEDAHKARLDATAREQQFAEGLSQRLRELSDRNAQTLGEMRVTLETQLKSLQADNAQKLEQMRATVDEKLQSTLEARLGQSFKLVSERLEAVQRGLGEMQTLAAGVGDLKRVLTNVKDRGGWGEIQLENLLEQVLTAEQFSRSVKVRPDSNEAVDFAIRLPGQQAGGAPVWLPIDAKFPREDYERLLDAQERGDAEAMRIAASQLERAIKLQAKSISDKYVVPPHTTDFAVLFLATEGLYAEAIRRPGLVDTLQQQHRIVIAGPTTLAALLNSLQMGFRTLAIEKRSSEVWQLLGAVKTEFGKFAAVLESADKQLNTVQNSLKQAGTRTRAIERKLRGVESLPGSDTQQLLEADED
ncbi:MAG: DNA recombination protein RmuC [Xanthomonadaceae bacterium]|nr:DNA recombination protein RmuC [Xanthomonadaceae bacterium]